MQVRKGLNSPSSILCMWRTMRLEILWYSANDIFKTALGAEVLSVIGCCSLSVTAPLTPLVPFSLASAASFWSADGEQRVTEVVWPSLLNVIL